MRHRTAQKALSVLLAGVLILTCGNNSLQPLAALAAEGTAAPAPGQVAPAPDPNAGSAPAPDDIAPGEGAPEAQEPEASAPDGTQGDGGGPSDAEQPLPSVGTTEPDRRQTPSGAPEPSADDVAGLEVSPLSSSANGEARAAADITANKEQLALGIGFLKWKNADGAYTGIEPAPDGTYKLPAPFESIKALRLMLDFKVLKDDDTRTIREGDFFTFSLAQTNGELNRYFSVQDITQPQDIMFGGTKVASYVIVDNVLKVTFAADVSFESGFSKIKGGIGLEFSLNDAAFDTGDVTGIDLVLQDQSRPLHMTVPPKASVVDGVEKTGAYDPATRTIAWTVSAGTETPGLDMGKMQIVDTFDAGKLEFSDAFAVTPDGETSIKDAIVQDPAGTCSYAFPDNAVAPQTIKILTKVKDGAPPTGRDASTLVNDVALQKGASPYDPGTNAKASGEATVPPMGLKKQGEQVGGDVMRWSIVVNENEDAQLYNAVITDVLAANLEYVDKTLKLDGKEATVLDSEPITPPTSDYATLVETADGTHTLKYHFVNTEFGDKKLIAKKHTLTFETKLLSSDKDDKTVRNEATLDGNWPEGDGPGPGFHNGMGIGTEYRYAFVNKGGSADKRTGVITWEVGPQLRMADYLSATLVDVVDASDQLFQDGSVALEYQGTAFAQADLVDKGWLSVTGSGTDADPATLVFTLPATAFPQLNEVHITYKTVAVASSLGEAHTYNNRVDMTVETSVGTFANAADASVPLDNNLIGKTAEYEYDDAANKGWLHYTLTVNAGRMALKNVVVTDDFSKLAARYCNANGEEVASVPADAWIIDESKTVVAGGAHEAATYENGLFSVKLGESASNYEIDSAYTIDLYLTLTDKARQTYLLESGSGSIRTTNEANVAGECAGGSFGREVEYVTTPEGGDVKNELVDKSSLLKADDGYIRWRVDVNPQGARLENAVVKDVLNKSLQLDFTSVQLYKSKHGPDGGIAGQGAGGDGWDPAAMGWEEAGTTFSVEPGENGSSVLSVELPDGAQAYTLMYDTAIIEAVDGGWVQNRASLVNDGVEKGDGSHTQDVGDGAWGYLERTASFRFQKVDSLGGAAQPLGAGVRFVLYDDEACTQLLKIVTANESGVFGFYGLEPGKTFWYRELSAPAGYVLDDTVRKLEVPVGTFGLQPGVTQVANTRVQPASATVTIEKQFEFDAVDSAYTGDKKASFKLAMRPLGEGSGKAVGIELDGSSGAYAYKGVAASAENATEMETSAATGDAPAKAQLVIANLPWGDYELTETGTMGGYARLSGAQRFSVAQDGTVTYGKGFGTVAGMAGAAVLANAKTSITVHKHLNGTEKAVAGAEFKILDSAGASVVKSPFTGAEYAWQPNGSAWVIEGLPAGDYVLRETSPADDTTIAQLADVPFTVNADGSLKLNKSVANVSLNAEANAFTLNNVPCASVEVRKLDQYGQAVKGATVALQKWDGAGGGWEQVGDAWTTGDAPDGAAHTFAGLLRSTRYRVVETVVPDGYAQANHDTANPQAIEFRIDEYGQMKDVDLHNGSAPASFKGGSYQNARSGSTFTLRNERIVGHLQFAKMSSDGAKALPGATFDLYRVAQGAETEDVRINVGGSFTSDAQGEVTTVGSKLTSADTGLAVGKGLLPGTYYFKEANAPADFALDAARPATTSPVEVEADGSNRCTWNDGKVLDATPDGTLANTPLAASVRVLKATADGAALNGAVFELSGTDVNGKAVKLTATSCARGAETKATDSSGFERAYATDHDGEALFANVPAGTYTVKEIAPPPGCKLNGDIFSVTVSRTDAGKSYELNPANPVKNEQNTFTVSKTDLGGNALAGAEFKLEGTFADGSTTPLTWISATAPETISGKLVAGGEYTLTETKAPEHYVIAAQPCKLKMDEFGALSLRTSGASTWTPVADNAVTVENDPVRGHVVLAKSIAGGASGTVRGVEFSLYMAGAAQDGSDLLIAEKCTIDAAGTWTTVGQTAANPNTNEALSEGLAAGSYYFVETKATPDTVLDATRHEFAVEDADHYAATSKPVAVTAENIVFAASFELSKLDGTSGEPLADAAFELSCTPEGGGTPQIIPLAAVEGKTGAYQASNLKKGSYAIRETTLPNGYESPFEGTFTLGDADNGKTVTVREGAAAGGATVFKTSGTWSAAGVTNTRILGSMTLVKQDNAAGGLSGTEFTLEARDGASWKKVDTYTTDDAGALAVNDMPWGDYRITETKAPDGFVPGDNPPSFTFAIGPDTGTQQHLEWNHGVVTNAKTRISIDKVDNAAVAQRLAGAKLKLTGSFADGSTEKAWESAADAAETFEGQLVVGETYTLAETERLAGHLALPGPITFAVSAAGTLELKDNPAYADGSRAAALSGDALALSVRNVRVLGTATLLKTDAETHEALSGATFSLFASDGALVREGLTTGKAYTAGKTGDAAGWTSVPAEEGRLTVKGLDLGTYYFQETAAAGYQVPDTRHGFTVSPENGVSDPSVDLGAIENVPTELTFDKHELYAESCSDESLGACPADATRALAGAEFTVYADEECTMAAQLADGADAVATSDAAGKVTFKRLPGDAAYWVRETAAPAGRALDTAVYEAAFAPDGTLERFERAGEPGQAVARVVNDVVRADIRIKKVAETDESKVLPNSVYGLFKRVAPEPGALALASMTGAPPVAATEAGALQLVAKAATGPDGFLTFRGVLMGTEYVIQELEAPDGSLVSKNPITMTFAVDADGTPRIEAFDDGSGTAKVDENGTVVWLEPQVAMGFAKTDPAGKLLAGARLQVVDANGAVAVAPWTSSAAGAHVVEGVLAAGETYRLVELEAPAGYAVAADVTFTVEDPAVGPDEGFVQHVSMVDEPLPAKAVCGPSGLLRTGDPALQGMLALAGIAVLAVAAVGASTLRKRRR